MQFVIVRTTASRRSRQSRAIVVLYIAVQCFEWLFIVNSDLLFVVHIDVLFRSVNPAQTFVFTSHRRHLLTTIAISNRPLMYSLLIKSLRVGYMNVSQTLSTDYNVSVCFGIFIHRRNSSTDVDHIHQIHKILVI